MQIGDRQIGLDHPPYIIAEIGVNHDGELSRALELTDAAADVGADAVKLQFFETDRLMSKAAKLAAYQKNAGETDPIEMLRRLELNIDEMAQVVDRAHKRGIHAVVTVFSTELVEVAETLAWDAYKTASPDIVNRPLLEALMATGKPMIVSTGASTLDEVIRAVGWLDGARDRLAVLQCVSCYPAPDSAMDGIKAIQNAIGLPTGYSDHTTSTLTGREASNHGAVMIEKHLTYDPNAQGPDHRASLSPELMRQYIVAIDGRSEERTKIQNGAGKQVLDCECDVREVARQSVVSMREIAPGETITSEMLTIKRPGTGILAYEIDTVVGRIATRAIEQDVPMMEEDLE